jgi:hypothetical protein
MRRLALVLLVVAASLGAASTSGSGARVPGVSLGRGINVRLPDGWHLVQRVVGPSRSGRPTSLRAGAIASFPLAFGRRPCPCAHPNYRTCGAWCEDPSVRDFPSTGAAVFLWELPSPRNPAALGRGFGFRPGQFRVVQKDPQFAQGLARRLRALHRPAARACVEGPGRPSWWSDFREAGRVFQLEVYLGPAAGPPVLARLDALLNSLEVRPLR